MKFVSRLLIAFTLLLFCAVAEAEMIKLQPGQKLLIPDGSYLTQQSDLIVLVNKVGQKSSFPLGSKIEKKTNGQFVIWGTGGTTIWQSGETKKFDDPLLKPKKKGFDDPLLQPKSFDDPLLKPKGFDDPLLKPAPKKFDDPLL
ncbi:MAG: hypothetical protein KKB30_01105 [Proteobacteria bacterium]|nr:hypothetical protein [Pseudomonadota bacterium]MBU1716697.1 hypothetical protein [Pseudomonadota bacterium]